jgi:peptidoglycan DL-endopeptidase CwlO
MAFPGPPRRRTRWVLLAALAAACAAGATAPATARAGRLADARAQARQVEARLNQINAQVDVAVQRYDAAASRLNSVNAQIKRNTAALTRARADLRAAQAQLASLLAADYKGSSGSVTMYVLGSESFTDLINRIEFVQRADRQQAQLLHQIQTAKRRIETRRAALKVEKRKAKLLVHQAASRRRQVLGLLHHEQQVLAGVKHNIAVLIQQAQARAARLARERAQAAARAAAARAAQPTPPVGTGGSGQPVPIPPAGTLGEKAVQIAETQLGVPYVWGGASPQQGFDCSGLTMWVYAQLGIHLDHYTGSQWNAGPHVPRDELEPGDLVFFEPDIGHVGMYIGDGLFIQAPHTGTVVQITSLSDPWYASEYDGAVRVTG